MKELKTWLIVGLLVLITGLLTAQYNAYALHKLSARQLEIFAEIVPPNSIFRFGGEEYEHLKWDEQSLLKVGDFLTYTNSKAELISGVDFEGAFSSFPVTNTVTFKNEIWFEITEWKYVRKDFWTYLLNRPNYYRKHARKYVQEGVQFQSDLMEQGHDIELVLNVPLPQNKNLRAMLDEIGRLWHGKVSIHIYGKIEDNYLQKIEGWVLDVKRKFGSVMVGEFSGVELKRWPNLKNTLIMRDLHRDIISILLHNGITEIYYFTAVMPESAENWQNPPVYHRFTVGTSVRDNLNIVFGLD